MDTRQTVERLNDEINRRNERGSGERVRQLKLDLANQFGIIHGWRLSKPFSLRCLARGKANDGGFNRHTYSTSTEFMDHPYYYRCGIFSAAIAAHLYNFNRLKMQRFAELNDLLLYTPDFPSWHYPDGTTLVVYVGPAGLPGIMLE